MARERGRKKRRYGWHRPRRKDPAFWAAVGIAAVVVAVQAAIYGDWSSPMSWLVFAVRVVLTWLIVSSLIRIRVGMRRQLVAGFAEAEVRAEARAAQGKTSAETVARAGGRTLGRAMGAYKRAQQPPRD
jgi:hypothetical protein